MPLVSITPGGAAVRLGGPASESVRSQISITDVARECQSAGNGAVAVRVGAQGRVALGPAGGGGGQFATMRIEVRKGNSTIQTRSVRVGGAVPSGQAGADWVHVEQPLVIPAGVMSAPGDLDIFVTLGAGGAEPRARGRRG